MAIDYDKLLSLKIPSVRQSYSAKDAILYALGVGVGSDADDTSALPFIYEADLKVLPTFAVVLAQPGQWLRDLDTGVDYVRVLHGEQRLTLHAPLPAEGEVIGHTRVVDVIDKGAGRGALLLSERSIHDAESGKLLATVGHTTVCRADGGFGGPASSVPRPYELPTRNPDAVCTHPTTAQAAFIYRLSADLNPLHVDPEIARAAGFARPILHGLATYGAAGYALVKTVCGGYPACIQSVDCRFTAPAYAGDIFTTDIWIDGNIAVFRTRAVERDVVVISNGRCVFNR